MNIDHEFFKINLYMHCLEDTLTIHPLRGGLKIPLGIIQSMTALSVFIFSKITSVFQENNSKISDFSKKHIVHGLANILSGTIEIIPLIGSFIIDMIRERYETTVDNPEHKDYVNIRKKENIDISYPNLKRLVYPSFMNPYTKFLPYYTVEEYREWVNTLPDKK
jgi:hypothetical protein